MWLSWIYWQFWFSKMVVLERQKILILTKNFHKKNSHDCEKIGFFCFSRLVLFRNPSLSGAGNKWFETTSAAACRSVITDDVETRNCRVHLLLFSMDSLLLAYHFRNTTRLKICWLYSPHVNLDWSKMSRTSICMKTSQKRKLIKIAKYV